LTNDGWIRAELSQDGRNHTAFLLEQDGEEMLRRRLRIAAFVSQPLGGLKRLLGLDRKAVWLHQIVVGLVKILV
jgi:hypothetical protein